MELTVHLSHWLSQRLSQSDPARTSQSHLDPVKTSQNQSEPARTSQSHLEPVKTSQNQSDPARTSQRVSAVERVKEGRKQAMSFRKERRWSW